MPGPVDVWPSGWGTVKESDLRGLKKLANLAGSQFKMGVLLYDGTETMPLGNGIWAAPLSTLWGT